MPVKIEKDNSILISEFNKGIGQSILGDFSDMSKVSLEKEGVAYANFKFQKLTSTEALGDKTFDYFNGSDWNFGEKLSYRGQENYFAITVSSTGDLPEALSEDTIYYIKYYTTSGGIYSYRFYPTLKDAFAGTNFINEPGEGSGTLTAHFIFPSTITDYTTNPNDQIFALDDNQRVWFLGSNVNEPFYLIAGNTGPGTGQGIVFYKGYIIVFGGTVADALADINSPGIDEVTWTNGFATGIAITGKPFYSINDDSIYFLASSVTNRYFRIGLLEENAGETFAPGTGSTFTYLADALTIPYESSTSEPTVINELNEYIVVGTKSNKIYFWDKKSPSFTFFTQLPEKNIHDIEVINSMLYCVVGDSGSIYVANTNSSQLLTKLPEHISERYDYKRTININSVAVYNDKLLISMSYTTGTTTAKSFIFSIDIQSGVITKFGNSDEGENVARNSKINKIIPQGDNIFISVQNYIDDLGDYIYTLESLKWSINVDSTKLYYFGTGSIETGLISYGNVFDKKTLRNIQVSLLRNLNTGESINLYYRRNNEDNYTAWKTIDYTNYGEYKDIIVEAPLTDIIDLQVKIEIVGTNTTTPYLKFIRLIP